MVGGTYLVGQWTDTTVSMSGPEQAGELPRRLAARPDAQGPGELRASAMLNAQRAAQASIQRYRIVESRDNIGPDTAPVEQTRRC
jgi:hypothetical protein